MDDHHPVVLFAMDRECRPFRGAFPEQQRRPEAPCRGWTCKRPGRSLLVLEVGIGPAKTQRALDWLASLWPGGSPRAPFLVMAGFAGSLASGLGIADVFVADDVVDLDGNCWPTAWPQSASETGWTRGRLLTTPRMIGDPAEKHRLSERHAAQAVDMESATVARFCHGLGLPFGCVRTISDNVDDALSPHLVDLLGSGQVSIPRLLKTLVLHPSIIGSLLKLARDTRRAALALSAALNRLLTLPFVT